MVFHISYTLFGLICISNTDSNIRSYNFYRPMFLPPAPVTDRRDCFLNIMLVCVCVAISGNKPPNRSKKVLLQWNSQPRNSRFITFSQFWIAFDMVLKLSPLRWKRSGNFRSYVHRANWDSTTVSGQLRCFISGNQFWISLFRH